MSIKPQLADDIDLAKVVLPVMAFPKIDGVRAWHPENKLLGRSMDPFKGFQVTERWSKPEHRGLDGEMTLGPYANGERLCSLTTGAIGKFKGVTIPADLHWWIFDYVTPATLGMPYIHRWGRAKTLVGQLENPAIHMVHYDLIETLADLERIIGVHLDLGYEGTVTRRPDAIVKQGRPSTKVQEFMRFKPWVDFEAEVIGLTEGSKNNNEAKTNTLGRTERSTSKEGLVPNGEIGSIQAKLLADFKDMGGRVLFPKGFEFTMSTGEMTVAEAKYFFEHQDEILGKIAKGRSFAYGTKDTLRMAQFAFLRDPVDMS